MCGSTSPTQRPKKSLMSQLALFPSPEPSPEAATSSAASSAPSPSSDFNPILHFQLSSKLQPRPYSWALKRRPVVGALLSGTILQPSTATRGAERWIASLGARAASRSAKPDEKPGSKTTAPSEATSTPITRSLGALSLIFCASSTNAAQASFFSRMSPSGLLPGPSCDLGIAFKNWVTRLKARSFSLREALERRIDASVHSYSRTWQTPKVSRGAFTRDCGKPGAERLSLRGEVEEFAQMFPTAKTPSGGADAPGARSARGAGGASLIELMRSWPTAVQADDGQKVTPACQYKSLIRSVAVWPWATPVAWNGGTINPGGNAKDLRRDAPHFGRLPSSHRTKGLTFRKLRRLLQKRTPTQRRRTLRWLRALCALESGAIGALLQTWTRPECPRLNPEFQWWLMGWVCPGETFSESAETAWSRWRLQQHSSLCAIQTTIQAELKGQKDE